MEVITVEDLMVPLDEYALVHQNATLFEAVMALEQAQEERDHEKYPFLHRAVLVHDDNRKIVGKIGHIDILRAIEPKYKQMGDTRTVSRAGFSPEFIRSMMDSFQLCDTSLTDMCRKGRDVRVRDFMYTPAEGEFVEAEASLCEAIHQFVIGGSHIGLLVVRNKEIVGTLRLSDVFIKVFEMMRQCSL